MKNKYANTIKASLSLIAMLSFVIAIIVPLHPTIIDLAVVSSLLLSVLIYMRANTIGEWNQFKTFPTILLLAAIFRIALNISTTRRILHDGEPGVVIEGFGDFVVGSNIWIGFVIFIILIVVQFIIANGASRTAEVAARFTLDSLPGKQMSIDSDLQQKLISEEEAKDKRKKLEMEIDFYGNMDGAGKFVKGDVIAGIVLVIVNITFGLIIGVVVQGMSLPDAAYRFTLLTIGDGLVNQIASLLIAVAAGIVMTRVYDGSNQNVTQSIMIELTNNPIVLNVVGAIFISLGVFTPLPVLPFLIIGGSVIYIGYQKIKESENQKKKEEEEEKILETQQQENTSERVEVLSEVEPISLEVGIALIPVVEDQKGGETLKDKIILMRKNIAREVGVKVPSIRIIDNSSLMPYTKYQIKIKDNLVAEGELMTNHFLALKTPYVIEDVEGQQTKDPVYGESALWVTENVANQAKEAGYMVYDALSILSLHLDEMIRKYLYELLQRQQVQELLDYVGQNHKVLIKEVDDNEQVDLSKIQGVLQNLLRENLSIRDLPTILEAILDGSKISDNIDGITTIVRERMAKQICQKNKNDDGKMYVLTLDSTIESAENTYLRHDGYHMIISPSEENGFMQGLIYEIQKAQMAEVEPVILVSARRTDLRHALARMIHKYNIQCGVIATNELVQGVQIDHLGVISIKEVQN